MEDLDKILGDFDKKKDIIALFEKAKEEAAKTGAYEASKEAGNYRHRIKDIKKLIEPLKIDVDSDSASDSINELLNKLASGPKIAGEKDSELQSLQKQIDGINKLLEDEKKKNELLEKDGFVKGVKSNINKALTEQKALDPDIADIIYNKLDLSDHKLSPEAVVFKDDGKNIFDGVKGYLESKPHLKLNGSLPGGGSTENNGATGGSPTGTKLTPAQKIAAGFARAT